MRLSSILTLIMAAYLTGCGDGFAVPTAPGAGPAVPTDATAHNTCTPGSDPNCPAVVGSLTVAYHYIDFNFTARASFAECQDSNGSGFTRLLVTNRNDGCTGSFDSVPNARDLLFALTGDPNAPSVRSLGALANDPNGTLILPTSDPNTHPADPNGVGDPNAVTNPNTVTNANNLVIPETLTVTELTTPRATDSLRQGTFTAHHVSGNILHGSFNAAVCSSVNSHICDP